VNASAQSGRSGRWFEPRSWTGSRLRPYFDVAASSGNSFSTEVIQDCNLSGDNQLQWWNPAAGGGTGAWQEVVGDPGPAYSPGPSACVTVTLDDKSSPTIHQLSGTVFGVASPHLAPQVTSPGDLTVSSSTSFSYTVTTSGRPAPALTAAGTLPKGVTFHDNGDGTATISGPSGTAHAVYPLTVTATNTFGAG
jgi:hypothetical protein